VVAEAGAGGDGCIGRVVEERGWGGRSVILGLHGATSDEGRGGRSDDRDDHRWRKHMLFEGLRSEPKDERI
jgi:hypothetical protein